MTATPADSRQHLAARDACTSRSHRSTTPEPPAAVSLATPEPPAAVIASTPEPRSTTPEADDATYSVVVPNAETGVQDPAMTGVQDPRVSGVQDARDGGTGHEERGSQYPTSEVLSEASSDVVLSRSEMVTIGKRLVRNFYNKVPGVISEVVTDLGADGVSAALRDLDAAGERFPGQIGLEAAIRDRATPAPTRPHALYQRPKCDTCNGSKGRKRRGKRSKAAA